MNFSLLPKRIPRIDHHIAVCQSIVIRSVADGRINEFVCSAARQAKFLSDLILFKSPVRGGAK